MLVFKDPKVVWSVCRVLIAYSRIGEQINIIISPSSLRLFIVNSSLTVVGETVVPSKFYDGRENINVHVKAKAVEVASRVINRGKPSYMEWGFITTPSGEELLEIRAFYDSGIKKVLFIPCIQTVAPQLNFPPTSDTPFTFECLTSRLRDAFSHCDLGADEIKFSFLSDLVNIHTRKLNRVSSRRGRGIINSSGLSTTVSLDPKIFNQITTDTPRQIVFKFKEFRTVIGFFNRVGEKMNLRATFNGNRFASTTILDFKVVSPVFPEFEYSFKFLAKLSSDSNDQSGWLKIGRQPGWAYDEMNSEIRSRSRLFLSSQLPTQEATPTGSATLSANAGRQDPIAAGHADVAIHSNQPVGSDHLVDANSYMRPNPVDVDHSGNHAFNSNSNDTAGVNNVKGNTPVNETSTHPPPDNAVFEAESENVEEVFEIGYTQGGPSNVRGLFD